MYNSVILSGREGMDCKALALNSSVRKVEGNVGNVLSKFPETYRD